MISDFGLGRILDSDSTRKTLTGTGMGTPIYMAPEQYDDAKNANPRSDVYALGVILLELFQGRQRSGSFDLDDIPPGIGVLIRRCVQKDPARRFASVTVLKTAWNSLYENLAAAEHLKQAEAAIARLAASEAPCEDDARILLESLVKYRNDNDFLQKAIMSVNPAVFGIIERMDLDGLRLTINGFTALVTSQGWPFDFTDDIGRACEKIFLRSGRFRNTSGSSFLRRGSWYYSQSLGRYADCRRSNFCREATGRSNSDPRKIGRFTPIKGTKTIPQTKPTGRASSTNTAPVWVKLTIRWLHSKSRKPS